MHVAFFRAGLGGAVECIDLAEAVQHRSTTASGPGMGRYVKRRLPEVSIALEDILGEIVKRGIADQAQHASVCVDATRRHPMATEFGAFRVLRLPAICRAEYAEFIDHHLAPGDRGLQGLAHWLYGSTGGHKVSVSPTDGIAQGEAPATEGMPKAPSLASQQGHEKSKCDRELPAERFRSLREQGPLHRKCDGEENQKKETTFPHGCSQA